MYIRSIDLFGYYDTLLQKLCSFPLFLLFRLFAPFVGFWGRVKHPAQNFVWVGAGLFFFFFLGHINMRKESPKILELGITPKSKPVNFDVGTSIIREADWPEESKRKPGTVYLEDMPCQNRDEALGRFLSVWNQTESQIQFLISAVSNIPLAAAVDIYSLGLNINQIRNFIKNNSIGKLGEKDSSLLDKWLDKLGTHNTNRNRIVHANWVCQVRLENTGDGFIHVVSQEWLRKFTPPSKEDSDRLMRKDKKMLNKYVFSIRRIHAVRSSLAQLNREYEDIRDSFLKQKKAHQIQVLGSRIQLNSPENPTQDVDRDSPHPPPSSRP